MEFEPMRGDALSNIDELCAPPFAPFRRIHVEPVNLAPLHRQVRYDALLQRGNPDRTVGLDEAIENPARLLKGERLPRREEGIRSHAGSMPHGNHVGCVGRLKWSNSAMCAV
jgi:hypothetical protein